LERPFLADRQSSIQRRQHTLAAVIDVRVFFIKTRLRVGCRYIGGARLLGFDYDN
jgi:hypothetical protein